MKHYFYSLIKTIWTFFNKPQVAFLIVIIPVGFCVSFYNYYEIQSYYYPNNVVWVSAFDENNTNLNEAMLLEIKMELKKHNLELYLEADTIANEICIQSKSSVPNRILNEWCIYIGKQSLNNLIEKKQNNHCIKGYIYITNEVRM